MLTHPSIDRLLLTTKFQLLWLLSVIDLCHSHASKFKGFERAFEVYARGWGRKIVTMVRIYYASNFDRCKRMNAENDFPFKWNHSTRIESPKAISKSTCLPYMIWRHVASMAGCHASISKGNVSKMLVALHM